DRLATAEQDGQRAAALPGGAEAPDAVDRALVVGEREADGVRVALASRLVQPLLRGLDHGCGSSVASTSTAVPSTSAEPGPRRGARRAPPPAPVSDTVMRLARRRASTPRITARDGGSSNASPN